MYVEDEKDYIMRMIKQMIRALFSLIPGKDNAVVEMSQENKYEVSGKALDDYFNMVDEGRINEAENEILKDIDYHNKQELAALVRFYEHLGDKEERFLEAHDYSVQEVLDGLKRVAEKSGCGNMIELFLE